jgi:hypothetical protein
MKIIVNMKTYRKFIILISFFMITLLTQSVLCNAKTKNDNIKQTISTDTQTNYNASKKTSLAIFNHGKSAFKLGGSWFLGANFSWTRGTFGSIKNWSNEAIGFIVSAPICVVEMLYNVVYRWVIGVLILIYSFAMMFFGIVFVPAVWIWNNIFG